jgi:dTMP kinase
VPTEVAARRAEHRERTELDRQRDNFESDASLQQRCGKVYAQLAAEQWWSPWVVVDGVNHVDFVDLVDKRVLA